MGDEMIELSSDDKNSDAEMVDPLRDFNRSRLRLLLLDRGFFA